jgi:hypothetical protein
MRRRALLATLAAGALGGCFGGDGQPVGPDETATETPRPTRTPTDRPTGTPRATETSTPTETATETLPPAPDLSAYPGACPHPDRAESRVICADAAPADAPLTMTASTDRVELPGSATFTLSNDTGVEFRTNFYDWSLYKRSDAGWHYVTPWFVPEPLTPLPAGEAHTWDVRFDGELRAEGPSNPRGTDELAIHALGGGRYAFLTSGWFRPYDEERIVVATRFDLDGPPLELVPTNHVTDVETDGDVLRARWTELSGADRRPRLTYVLDRVAVPDPTPLVAEEVAYGLDPWTDVPRRDAFALLTSRDVTRVELTGQMDPPKDREYHLDYAFRGETYRADLVEA